MIKWLLCWYYQKRLEAAWLRGDHEAANYYVKKINEGLGI